MISVKSGVTFDDLWAYNDQGKLRVGIRGDGANIAVSGNFQSGNNVIKTLDMAGVGQVDLTQIAGGNILSDNADTLNGSPNTSSIIFGNNGNDVINATGGPSSTVGSIVDGGLGNDTISTSTGDDQFLFERGDGHDVVTDTGGQNTVVFGSTVSADDVIYEVVQDDLFIGIKDLTNTSLTASQVTDNIKFVGAVDENVGMLYGGTSWTTSISVEAGGATTDLTKANIACKTRAF